MQILLTGNLFHDYELDIKEGLEQLGHHVDIRFNNIHGPYHPKDVKTFSNWMRYGFLPYKLKIKIFTQRSIEQYNKDVQQLIRKNNYDLLLVIGAKTIYEETIQLFKGRKVFWFMDALPRYQYVIPKIHLFDDLFVFEPTDVQYIDELLNRKAIFHTLAFNPQRYYKKQADLKYDFSFVGSYYPKREQFLNAILEVSHNLCICGDFNRASNKELRKKVKGINVPHSVANDLYNSSKINLNIHHDQSKEGLAIRTFEIIGAGGFELMDRQKAALDIFKENENMVFYNSCEEMIDKSNYYLKNDGLRKKIARSAYEEALKNHTWKTRMEQLLVNLKK